MQNESATEYTIEKDEFEAREDQLRSDLIETQLQLLEDTEFPVVVLLTGMDFRGRSAAARRLMSWMDPRHVRLYADFRVHEEDYRHPRMWRYWRVLPPNGRIGLFLNSWYDDPVSNYLIGDQGKAKFRARMQQIKRFERMLAAEGTLLLKFYFHVPKSEASKSLKDATKRRATAWKMSADDKRIAKQLLKDFDYTEEVLNDVISQTGKDYAPWIPLFSSDPNYRDVTVAEALTKALRNRMSSGRSIALDDAPSPEFEGDAVKDPVGALDFHQTLEKADYKDRLQKLQTRVSTLTVSRKFEERGLVALFEGNDAAGKGGCIRRLVAALDPRMISVVPIAGPTGEEREQPYLWRFWRHVPEHGRIVIFDRSWYGRVLVERVEGFCSEADWQRAYGEIRDFEDELTEHGLIVMKFWLAIDRDEQLRRFQARKQTPYKRHKITEEDWRNREKWDDYSLAVRDMVNQTDTAHAPWTLVAANDKRHARVAVLEAVAKRLKEEL